MAKHRIIPEQKDEYLGNIWGWKTSFLGLGLILMMLGLMWWRSCQIKQAPAEENIELLSTENG